MKRTFLSLALAAAIPAAAPAAVFEVGEDGRVAVRSGAGVVAWEGEDEAGAGTLPLPTSALPSDRRVPAPWAAAVAQAAADNNLSPALIEALVWQESRWNPKAVSRVGARGLAQLMPATARALGVDAADPIANIAGGARYLRQQLDRFGGDLERALAAYNAGPLRVLRAGGIPAIAETRAYVAAIVGRLSAQGD